MYYYILFENGTWITHNEASTVEEARRLYPNDPIVAVFAAVSPVKTAEENV